MATSVREIRNRGAFVCEDPSSNRYANGCRCFHCTAAQRRRMREYYQAKGRNPYRKPDVERDRNQRRKAAGFKREWTPERRAAFDLREMRKKGVLSEKFTHLEIFNRDAWICGICAKPVDSDLSFPDRFSSSLDHIVPLSLGGSHTRRNVRCSHLTCNIARGNRVETDALAAS